MKALCQVVVQSSNFKVRINAAAALAVPTNEQFLQNHFAYIWSSLLEALDRSDEITDFNEYQHRDHLTEQVRNYYFDYDILLIKLSVALSHNLSLHSTR